MSDVVLSARWRHLAMLSWPVDRSLLLPSVPAGTELDLHDGSAWLSLVGFRFLDTRLLGVSVPGHRDFDEINLRFYLRRRDATGWQRGVAFIRELVPRRAIAWIARACYNEPYRAVPMTSRLSDSEVEYRWRTTRWHRLHLRTAPEAVAPHPDSRESWIAEHYWGWTRQRDGGTIAYRVEHPPWRLRSVLGVSIDADLAETFGADWSAALAGTPASAFVAEGSAITVGRPRRLA